MSDGHTDSSWMTQDDPEIRRPDFEGRGGEAWKMPAYPDDPATISGTALSAWLVRSPGGHPFWDWYYLTGCTLENAEGAPPAKLQYDGAEYEFQIWALNPDFDHEIVDFLTGDKRFVLHRLEPVNVVTQFDGCGRDGANHVIEAAAKVITEGLMSPDSDFRRQWNDAVKSTADHFAGKHSVGEA